MDEAAGLGVKRVLVTGSRDWTDVGAVHDALAAAVEDLGWVPLVIVHGDCPTGADRIADAWCAGFNKAEAHPADWGTYGKAAGPLRNAKMVSLGADLCLAFPLANSRGTKDCMLRAEAAGIPVRTFGAGKAVSVQDEMQDGLF